MSSKNAGNIVDETDWRSSRGGESDNEDEDGDEVSDLPMWDLPINTGNQNRPTSLDRISDEIILYTYKCYDTPHEVGNGNGNRHNNNDDDIGNRYILLEEHIETTAVILKKARVMANDIEQINDSMKRKTCSKSEAIVSQENAVKIE